SVTATNMSDDRGGEADVARFMEADPASPARRDGQSAAWYFRRLSLPSVVQAFYTEGRFRPDASRCATLFPVLATALLPSRAILVHRLSRSYRSSCASGLPAG